MVSDAGAPKVRQERAQMMILPALEFQHGSDVAPTPGHEGKNAIL